MCGQSHTELAADPRSARRGRDVVARTCRRWDVEPICAELSLPVSELVTNAILHAGTDLQLTISLTWQFIEVAVRDRDRRPPIVRPIRLDLEADLAAAPNTDARYGDWRERGWDVPGSGSLTAGRGLHIVNAVADEWGIAELSGGKDVWFRVRTPPGWQPKQPCPCPGGTLWTPGGLRLAISDAYRS